MPQILHFLAPLTLVGFLVGASLPTELGIQPLRLLLKSGKIQSVSLELARREPSPEVLALRGDLEIRLGHISAARQNYQAALALDPQCALAHWGIGRLHQMRFQLDSARQAFADAELLASDDPAILGSSAEVAENPAQRLNFLKRYLEASRNDPLSAQSDRESAVADAQLTAAYPGLNALVSPYQTYNLPAQIFHPGGGPGRGLLIPVSINGARPLQLLLDTGAKHIVISAKSAASLGLDRLSESRLGGLGTTTWTHAEISVASTVTVAGFQLQNVVVEISDHRLSGEVEGVVGLEIFSKFLIQLKPSAHCLSLTPFTEPTEVLEIAQRERPRSHSNRWLPLYRVGHFLLASANWENQPDALFLLDTGASYTIVSKPLAQRASVILDSPDSLPLRGAGGDVEGFSQTSAATFRFATGTRSDRKCLIADLSELSQRQGIELSGILGFSLLTQSSLTLNLRDGLFALD